MELNQNLRILGRTLAIEISSEEALQISGGKDKDSINPEYNTITTCKHCDGSISICDAANDGC